MTTDIDELQIRIEADAKKAENSIDVLVDKLDMLCNSLFKLDSKNMDRLAISAKNVSSVFEKISGIDGSGIKNFALNIKQFSKIDTEGISRTASAFSGLYSELSKASGGEKTVQSLASLANSVSRFGTKSATNAIVNIPQLATALNEFMVVMSKAPKVNKNLISMTNALANLASNGKNAGTASRALITSLSKANQTLSKTSKNVNNTAASFGRMYISLYTVIRGLRALYGSFENAMDLAETVNYFEVTLDNIGKDAVKTWNGMGYDSAEAYAESFAKSLRENTEKLTGLSLSETGQIGFSKYEGLGLSPGMVTQYSAMFAQVANSIGMTEKASVALSETFVRLGADWASLRNMDFEAVYEKLASAMSGQSRALRTLGVDISLARLQEEAYKHGITKTVAEMTQAEKTYLRLISIVEQSEVAYGDLANTISLPANSIRLLKQGLENFSTLTGTLFMPMLQKALPIMNGFVIALNRILVSIAEMMGIDTKNINQSIGGIDENFGDLGEDIEGATEAANKFNKAVRGWDELHILGGGLENQVGNIAGNVELETAFYNSIEKYRKAWEEAYAQMENQANDFADKLLGGTDAMEKVKDLTEAIKDFREAMQPFGEGFGKGFTQVFETLGGVSYRLITEGLENISKVVGYFDDDAVEKAGEVMGGIVGTLVVAAGIKTTFTPLVTGVGKLAGALKNPIFGTFALTSGILTLIDMANDTDYDASGVQEFADKVDNLKDSLINLGEEDTEGFTAASSLETVYEKWQKIAFKVGELTTGEKGLLKLYGDQIKAQCEGANEFIDENGAAFAGVGKELDDLIKKTVLYYKVQGAKDYMESLYVLETEFEIETENAEKKIDALVEKLQGFNPKLTEETIRSYADGLARGVLDADAILTGKEKQFGIERNFLGLRTEEGRQIYEEVVNAMRDLSTYYPKYDEALGLLEETREKMSAAAENYTEKQNEYNIAIGEGTVEVDKFREAAEKNVKVNGIASEKFKILGGALDKAAEASEKAAEKAGLPVEPIDNLNTLSKEAAKGVIDLEEALDGINDKTFKTTLKVLFETPKLDFSTLIPNSINGVLGGLGIKLPKFAAGGFPEDGLFMANHSELVGKFSNGRTAVANNDQITRGIADAVRPAVYEAMKSALRESDMGAHFTVEGDPNGIFRVVQKQASQYTKSTGRNAFG